MIYHRMVLALVGTEEIAGKWWTGPNCAFDMQTPITQDLEKVYKYLATFLYR